MRRKTGKGNPGKAKDTKLAMEVMVRNDTHSAIFVQGYGGRDAVLLCPARRVEVPPGEARAISVPSGLLGRRTVQLAMRMRYCAKLLKVRRGTAIRILPSLRGRAVDIKCKPKDALSSMRDVSHWSIMMLPQAGGRDCADVDSIHGPCTSLDQLQAWVSMNLALGVDQGNAEVAIPLIIAPPQHPQLPLQLVSSTAGRTVCEAPIGREAVALPPGAAVVGTIRCGYGHHRIALALSSFGNSASPPVLHDFAAIGRTPPVELLNKIDHLYSRLSRLASEDPSGIFEHAWNQTLTSGDANKSRGMRRFCERLKPLLLDVPPDTPIISAHTFVGITALLCGFRRVINVVFDNHVQPVHVVPPPAINVVQTPKCLQQLLEMGVPPDNVRLVGHFVPKELAENAVVDSFERMERAARGEARRFLFSVGGAGAQQSFITGMLQGLIHLSRQLPQGIHVMVNIGDHLIMREAMLRALSREGADVAEYSGLEAAVQFAAGGIPRGGQSSFSLFLGNSPIEATGITDVLVRVADILVTKPSELAFYPLPKLHVSRIGNHEALAAVRARELGDGTSEVRSVSEAVSVARALATTDAQFVCMCNAVVRQAKDGAYEGARRAYEMACRPGADP